MYAIIQSENGKDGIDIRSACRCLTVSKSAYHDWSKTETKPKNQLEMKAKDEIQKVATEFPSYGYRPMTHELRHRGMHFSYKRIRRLMKALNLQIRKRKYRICTTDSNHNLRVYPNLAKGLEVTGLNQLWVADITYIRLVKEFVYLAVVLDIFSRRCIGWALSRDIDTRLSLDALDMALKERAGADLSALIHHSDRGVQYASQEYVNRLKAHGILVSMSRSGNPYDNAYAESFMKTLKYEEVYMQEYETFEDAHQNVRTFIVEVYNAKRLHSGIGYLAPDVYEKQALLCAEIA